MTLVQNVTPLHHLLSHVAVDKTVSERLIKCLENGEKIYNTYRQEVLVTKVKKLNSSITKRKLPLFNDYPQKTADTFVKKNGRVTPKHISEAQRNIDIAKEHGQNM